MPNNNILRLLIMDSSLNDAEMVVNILRNDGLPIRTSHVHDEDELSTILTDHNFDIFLFSTSSEDFSLEDAVELIETSGKDISVIAISETDDIELRTSVIKNGALDLVSKDNTEHLKLVIARETKNHHNRIDLVKAKLAAKEATKRCQTLLDSSNDSIAYIHEGMHIHANKSYLEKFGCKSFDDLEGTPIMDMVSSQDQGKMKDFLRKHDKGIAQEHKINLSMTCDKPPFFSVLEFSPAKIDGEDCTQIVIRNSSETNSELEKQLESLTKQDIHTGLCNRLHFMESIDSIIADNIQSGSEKSYGLLYILIDDFKSIKETSGITSADVYVNDVAEILKDIDDEKDIICRFNDSCFAVMLCEKGVDTVLETAEKIRAEIENLISTINGQAVTSTSSIGVFMIGDSGESAHDAIALADQACTIAKEDGGNKIHLHKASSEAKINAEVVHEWESKIINGLTNDEFFLVYQPIASLQGDTQERYEVRIRLKGEDEEISPTEFLPIAEQAGLMGDIDKWVISNSIATLAKQENLEKDLIFFIKVSDASLKDASVLQHISEQLSAAGVNGGKLVFEVSEPLIVTYLNESKNFCEAVKSMGSSFTIDHFGSGLNPIQLMKHIDSEYIKIDHAITCDVTENNESQEKVKSIVQAAHDSNKKVIAVHLEDPNTLAFLWQYKLDFVQGYFLQAPAPDLEHDFSGLMI